MNYLLAFILCVACTVMTMLAEGDDLYWLIVSDMNVALFLFIAWLFDSHRGIKMTAKE